MNFIFFVYSLGSTISTLLFSLFGNQLLGCSIGLVWSFYYMPFVYVYLMQFYSFLEITSSGDPSYWSGHFLT